MLKKKLEELLSGVQGHSVVIGPDINQEARENMFILSLTSEELENIGEEAIVKYLHECELTIVNRSNSASVFYCWFDDMTRQIRLSAVSKSHGRLPFRCSLKRQRALRSIVEEQFKYLDPDYFNPNIDELSVYIND